MTWPDDDHEDREAGGGTPLPPDDRLWRHPSELGRFGPTPGAPAATVRPADPPARPPASSSLALTFLAGVLVGAGVLAVVAAQRPGEPVPMVIERVAGADGPLDPVAAAEPVLDSVVQLEVSVDGTRRAGSGVVFRDDGHVLTTADLLANADSVVATLTDGRTVQATVVGRDPTSDVGVVRLATAVTPTAVLGNATDLQPGERVIGAAGGTVASAPVVTEGVVSALGVTLRGGDTALSGLVATSQSPADLGVGAALINQRGAVVGLTTGRRGALDVDLERRGVLATPIELARHVADELIRDGRVDRPWLGVVPAGTEEHDGGGTDEGVAVSAVDATGPAAEAGLVADDVIVAVDGEPVTTVGDLAVQLRLQSPGEPVELAYRRDGGSHTCSATLEEWPDHADGV